MASVWGNRLALRLYGQLNEMILEKPTYGNHCDNASVVQLSQQLAASKTRTRHLLMRAAWLHPLVLFKNVSTQFAPTSYQRADILTKGCLPICIKPRAKSSVCKNVMICNCLFMDFVPSEEAAEQVNDNVCLFRVVLCTSPTRLT